MLSGFSWLVGISVAFHVFLCIVVPHYRILAALFTVFLKSDHSDAKFKITNT